MKRGAQAPWFGAAYYPEDWDEAVLEEDIVLMHEAGMNIVRVAEFAWSSMETEDGHFTFGWLDHVIRRMGEEQIAVVMGTPSATPPVWLTTRYPDMLMENDDGTHKQHGERRHCCSNHPRYRDYSRRIASEMAKRYAGNPTVIGWQIDNEIAADGRGCFCPHCVERYHRFLEEKYHTIKELNERLCLKLWSMEYQSFEQIPPPATRTWAHPSLIADWFLTQSRSHAGFVSMQADALRENGVTVPIGTDMMPILEQDYITTNTNLDVIQFNHYHKPTNLDSLIFWNDYLRNLKPRPFWNTETSTCWGGATAPAGYWPEGFCTANTWLSYAMGAESCMYWLWRSHWAGQEMMHGSVVSSCGRPLHTFDEVKAIGRGLEKLKDVLNNTDVVSSGIGMHMSHQANALFRSQGISAKMEGWAVYIQKLQQMFQKPLLDVHYRPDILDPSASLAGYRVILTPFLPCLDEGGLKERILSWVEEGGTWIVGPLSDIRTQDGTKYRGAPLGMLEKAAGVRLKYQLPAYPQEFTARFRNDMEFRCHIQCDAYEPLAGTKVIAAYRNNQFKNLAAITSRPYGRGTICVMGTVPSGDAFAQMMLDVCRKAGLQPTAAAESNIVVIPRASEDGKQRVRFCIEYTGRPGIMSLDWPARDLLSDRILTGDITIEAYEVLCLEDVSG